MRHLKIFIVGCVTILLITLFITPIYYSLKFLYMQYTVNNNSIIYIVSSLPIIYAIGYIFSNRRIPFLTSGLKYLLKQVGQLYSVFLVEAAKYFCKENEDQPFEKVVKIDISKDISIYGLVTEVNEHEMTVYLPTSPNPTSGFIVMAKKDKIIETKILPNDFIEYIVTSGAKKL